MPVNGLSDRFEFSIPREMLLPPLSKMASFAYFFLFLSSFLPFFLSVLFSRGTAAAQKRLSTQMQKTKATSSQGTLFPPSHALQRFQILTFLAIMAAWNAPICDCILDPAVPSFKKSFVRNLCPLEKYSNLRVDSSNISRKGKKKEVASKED